MENLKVFAYQSFLFFPFVLFHLAPITSMLVELCKKVMPTLCLDFGFTHRIMRAAEERDTYYWSFAKC